MSSPSYTTAELLALRNTRLSPHPPPSSADAPRATAHTPPHSYRAVIASQDAAFAFAHYESDGVYQVVVPDNRKRRIRWEAQVLPKGMFSPFSRLSRWLRYSRGVACFNMYPSCQRDLQINDLLWRVAQRGEYLPQEGNMLLEANVMSLAMPRPFFQFLARVSRRQLYKCMLQVLAFIAQDEDAEGLALMQAELEPSVWNSLTHVLQTSVAPIALMSDVQLLLQLCYLSPWKIDVYAGYVTPQDMCAVLKEARLSGSAVKVVVPDFDACASSLVRSVARRPVAFVAPLQLGVRRGTSKTRVFWKLFQDWRRYRKILVQGLGKAPAEVSETMLRSISNGSQREAWERAELVMAIACQRGNLLSALPKEVVFNIIAPYVLLAGSQQ